MVEESRNGLNIQQFMDDMRILQSQLQNKDIAKPVFDYGAPEVTNYLLWLLLGEMMILNDKVEED